MQFDIPVSGKICEVSVASVVGCGAIVLALEVLPHTAIAQLVGDEQPAWQPNLQMRMYAQAADAEL